MSSPVAPAAQDAPIAEGLEPVQQCVLCGGSQHSLYEPRMYELDERLLDLHRCHGCGFVFVTPRPTPERLRALYASEKYYETDYTLGVSGSSYFARRDELLARYDGVVAQLEKVQKPGRIYEVGAAGGFFLAAASRRGWDASGVEISPFAADYARTEMGIDVQTGDVTEATVEPSSQDVVYVDNILEHTIDPIDVLRRLRGIVRPGGLLVVIVPTYVNSPWFRLLKRLRGSALGGPLVRGPLGKVLKLQPQAPSAPYHIDEFCPRTIKSALEAADFQVERMVSSVPIPDYLESPGGSPGRLLMKACFHGGDAFMRAGLLPGGRVEVWGRRND